MTQSCHSLAQPDNSCGPVIMVQIENEYGHPQYIPVDEKKEFVRFLYQITAAYGFDIPLMGNDMQFAQDNPTDPVLREFTTRWTHISVLTRIWSNCWSSNAN